MPVGHLLPFVFAFFDFFEDGKTGLFSIRNRERLELMRRAESRDDLADGLFACGTARQLGGAQRPLQGELPAASLAVAFAQFIFVQWHQLNVQCVSRDVE